MLNDNMKIGQIDFNETTIKPQQAIPITQAEYDLIQLKDAYTIYIITDAKDRRVYIGDVLIVPDISKKEYLLGSSNKYGEYIIYINERDGYADRLIEISRFSNPNDAITALNRYNRVGSHSDLSLQVYNVLMSYIQNNISIHESLIGIISLFGYREDTRLQEVIWLATTHDARSKQYRRDFPPRFREVLLSKNNNPSNHLTRIYCELYKTYVLCDLFQGREYHKEEIEDIDLSEVIEKIFKIFSKKYK